MSGINQLHDEAMDLADQAFIAKRRGEGDLAAGLLRQALALEMEAAHKLRDSLGAEPSRSILYRSAASLAMDCGEHRLAERLIALALSGDPPPEIAEDLRDLLEQVNLQRHLRLRGIALAPAELQLSVSGAMVGSEMALADTFLGRIEDLDRLMGRMFERKRGLPFRERSAAPRSISREHRLFVSAPRAGSFSVTLRVGQQLRLPGFDQAPDVVSELVECLDLLNSGQDKRLREIISDEAYYRNFLGLARRIAPDGEDVTLVGLTAMVEGRERRVALTRRRSDIAHGAAWRPGRSAGKQSTVVGLLRQADAIEAVHTIKLLEESGQTHTVVVPEGMLADIVRPLWDTLVEVTGTWRGGRLHLETIDPVTSPPRHRAGPPST